MSSDVDIAFVRCLKPGPGMPLEPEDSGSIWAKIILFTGKSNVGPGSWFGNTPSCIMT